jgi:hypothetical protein
MKRHLLLTAVKFGKIYTYKKSTTIIFFIQRIEMSYRNLFIIEISYILFLLHLDLMPKTIFCRGSYAICNVSTDRSNY